MKTKDNNFYYDDKGLKNYLGYITAAINQKDFQWIYDLP